MANRSASTWPRLAGWLTLAALAVAAVLLAFAGPAYRNGWIELGTAFSMLRWMAYAGIAAAVIGAVAAVWNLISGSRLLAAVGAIALVAGAGLALHLHGWQRTVQTVPPIHDITTDTSDPPEFVDVVPLRADAPNPPEYAGEETAEAQRIAYPDLEPIVVQADVDQVMAAARLVVERMGMELVADVREDGRIEATDTTRYFGFRDDVVVRVRETPTGTVVDVRSKSRLGRSDAGTNAERIRDFRDRLLRTL